MTGTGGPQSRVAHHWQPRVYNQTPTEGSAETELESNTKVRISEELDTAQSSEDRPAKPKAAETSKDLRQGRGSWSVARQADGEPGHCLGVQAVAVVLNCVAV